MNVRRRTNPAGSKTAALLAGLVLLAFAAPSSAAEPGPSVSFTAPPPGGQHGSTKDPHARFDFASERAVVFACRVDSYTWQPCASPALYAGLAKGRHHFEVHAADAEGNVGPTLEHDWYVDHTPPETRIVSGPYSEATGIFTPSRRAELSFTAWDDWWRGFIAECRLDGREWEACRSAKVYDDLEDGEHVFQTRARDAVGHEEESGGVWNTYRWIVDTTAPSVDFRAAPPARTESRSASFWLETSEQAMLDCRLDDGDWAACDWSHEIGGLSEGDHVLAVRATDRARHVSEAVEHRWRIDDLPRTTVTRAPPERSRTGEADFEFTASEPATFECRVADAAFDADVAQWKPCSSPHHVSGLPDRRNAFEVRATDETGGTGPVAGHSWWVDTTPPDIYLSDYPASWTNSRRAEFVFSASENPVSFHCQVDGRDWTGCSSPLVLDDLPEGEHRFRVRARDETGNDARERSWSWSIDTQPPRTTITQGPDRTSDTSYASFAFESPESETRFQCRFDGGRWRDCFSVPQVANEYSEGDHVFEVFAIDRAGNEGPVARHPWTVSTGDSTNVQPPDVDGDGKPDGDDNCPADSNAGQVDADRDGRGDACDPDDDGDGLPDSRERELGSARLDRDSDDDGLSDGAEVRSAGTDPTKADSDRDGLADGLERGIARGISDPAGPVRGSDPARFRADRQPATKTDPRRRDSDRDSRLDGAEDADRDGRRDRLETDPRRWDTDGDGVADSSDRRPLDRRSS